MTRVLVLGSSGMLGRVVFEYLSDLLGTEVEGTDRHGSADRIQLEVAESHGRIHQLLDEGRYALAVNCVGVLNSRIDTDVASTVASAIDANALFPWQLAVAAEATSTRVLHISTDGVFSGETDEDYGESSRPDAAGVYGRTKILGEVRSDRVLNLRCSVIGRDPEGGRGLIEWILRSPNSATIQGYENHWWNGVATTQVAELCGILVSSDVFDEARRMGPIHHFCPNETVSKLDLLSTICDRFRPDLTIEATRTAASVRRVLVDRLGVLARAFREGEGTVGLHNALLTLSREA